jgi:hypothetical protein
VILSHQTVKGQKGQKHKNVYHELGFLLAPHWKLECFEGFELLNVGGSENSLLETDEVTVKSSLIEISTDQLGNRVVVRGAGFAPSE